MGNFNSVSEFCKNVPRGTFGVSLLAITVPNMNKRNNPYYGRVTKNTYLTQVALGCDYENTANGRLEKLGLEADFHAAKSNGKKWVQYPYILCADKDNTKEYLRCTMRKNTKAKVEYFLDGKIIENQETLTQIKSFFSKTSTSKKQEQHGLEKEDQVVVRDFTLNNIKILKQGVKIYKQCEM